MCSETDKDYMRAAVNIDRSISDEAIHRETQRQIQKNWEARQPMRNYFAIDHMAATDEPVYSDSAEDYKALDEEEIPYRDLLKNNIEEFDDFLKAHWVAYPDFVRLMHTFYVSRKLDTDALERNLERAIKEIER